ncbi:MAG: hypothetical protein U0L15_07035, partial [Oscillospiraceae bacterium]|nr:hypothetical protein [Oscillospiraceae bacterium]
GQRQKVFCSVDNQYFVLMDNEKGIYSFVESDVIPALDHETYTEVVIVSEPTCVDRGSKRFDTYCHNCDYYREGLPFAFGEPTGVHDTYTQEVIISNPTCVDRGSKRFDTYCQNCDYYREGLPYDFGDPLDHDLDEGEITTPATCVDKGVKTYSCQREGCDYTETETLDIDPDAHTGLTVIENANDLYTGDTHCASCGELLNKGEAIVPECGGTNCWYTLVEAKDATCVEKGNIAYYYCPDHNNYYSVEMEAITAEDVVVEIDPENHTGETVTKNESETYSGDIHCGSCDALLKEGEIIAVPSTPITPAKPTWKNWLDKVINNWKDKIECPEEPTEPEETVPEETEPEETEPEETVPAAPVTPAKPNWGSIIRGYWNWIFR